MTPECCRQPSEGSEQKAERLLDDCRAQRNEDKCFTGQRGRQIYSVKMDICMSRCCYLADGHGSVPEDHFLRLQNHFLIHELSWTLH